MLLESAKVHGGYVVHGEKLETSLSVGYVTIEVLIAGYQWT